MTRKQPELGWDDMPLADKIAAVVGAAVCMFMIGYALIWWP